MEPVYECVGGLDVHKKTVVACVRRLGASGKASEEVRTFGTMTADLQALAQWMTSSGVTHVAMESTGVFWKPVYNILEEHVTVLLVNARHIKQVPGRKTDVKDCQWIARLLHAGLLRASFVPSRALRDLRDLTRQRATLVQQTNAVTNRIHKVLEDANIKLAAVASDALGVSGRAMIEALIAGDDDPVQLAELARKRLRQKIPELQAALAGRVTPHHRFLLQLLLKQLDFLEAASAEVSARITTVAEPIFQQAVELLTTVDGIKQRSAENIVAEIGTNMGQFPSARHLASWAGVCPGNNESAGVRRAATTPKANRWLRRALGEAAWAAAHTKQTYLQAQFHRLAARRGKKRAVVAVSHTLLTTIYYMLRAHIAYADLGANHFERLDPDRLTRYHVRKLQALGHKVTLAAVADAA